jgi:hypothetical protein
LTEIVLADTVVVNPAHGYSVGPDALSLVNAGVAQAQGRSGLAWWLVSLLPGPFATFLIVLLGPVVPARETR